MSCNITTSFAMDCNDGVGGVKAIHLINWAATGFSEGGGEITGTTVASANTFTYDLKPNTANLTTTGTVSDENGTTVYQSEAVFKLFKMSTAKRNELKLLTHGRVFAIVQDKMNNYWLVGKESGATITTNVGETGTQMEDFNGYTLNLMAKESEPPFKLQASVVTTLGI